MRDSILKRSELHIHLLQALYPSDIFEMAKDVYREINWNRFGFLDRYEKIYGVRLDPIAMFDRAVKNGSIQEIEEVMVYSYEDRGDFNKFSIKSFFPICVTGYYYDGNNPTKVLKAVVERHKKEELSYVEYRNAFGFSENTKEEWKEWHAKFARFFKESSTDGFEAKYIIRISEEMYEALRELMRENQDLCTTIVGIDFTGRELAPKTHKSFFERLRADNARNPHEALDAVIHIGEDYFDKSIESAIRWCHEAALLGVKRLGHCIALGLDPEIAIKRCEKAHVEECVSERIDQIDYDLKYENELRNMGIQINRAKLIDERKELEKRSLGDKVILYYDEERLCELRKRQDFVLNRLRERGLVIEVCPTSNLRIGGIPDMKHHPFKKFYESGVNTVICTDDPGIFNVSLSEEIDVISRFYNIEVSELEARLGDPYRFRLGRRVR